MLTDLSSSITYILLAATSLILLAILYIKRIILGTQKVKDPSSLLFLSLALVMAFDVAWSITEVAGVQIAFFSFFANANWHIFFIYSCVMWFFLFNRQMRLGKLPWKPISLLVLIPFVVAIGLLISSIWTKWIIDISPEGKYARGPYFYLMYATAFLYLAAAISICVINIFAVKEKQIKRYLISLVLVPLPFIVMTVLQIIYSFDFGFIGAVASLAMYDIEYISNYDKQVELNQEMNKALEKSKVASEAKTKFLFNMSHDIRTPMNAIIGFTDMAIRDIDDKDKVVDYLLKSKFSSEALLALINDILDMSRIESGKIDVQENPHNILEMVKEIQPMMEELAVAKGLEISFNVDKVTHPYVMMDASRVERIFINIINNAIKYTNSGGWVHISFEQVDAFDKVHKDLRFVCSDNGHGMSEEFQSHMFEEFSREESSTASGIQGTGLGLSLCKALTDLMHGKIECNSTLGVGTTFTVTLPNEVIDKKTYNAFIKKMPNEEEQLSFNGKRVLLAEDNQLNREIVIDLLSEIGLIIDAAEDGIAAVDLVRKNGVHYYDFILMDIQMPRMNGYEATKHIRNLDGGKKIPIIALSANAFEEDKIASKKAGMNDHIAKPINIKELFTSLAKFIK